MEVAIIGWYGTETIGDRAILAGLLDVMGEAFPSLNVRIGSLYPFFTERTLLEDEGFYRGAAHGRLGEVSVFDSRCPRQLKKGVRSADLLVVGGGPLMDLEVLSMLEYAFVQAKAHRVKTALLGCGWGPLCDSRAIKSAIRLVEMADCSVFRDQTSVEQCRRHCGVGRVSSAIDPAFFACEHFLRTVGAPRSGSHVAVNFRDVAVEGAHYAKEAAPDSLFCGIVDDVAGQTDLPVYLVPMHYFRIGGDDRLMLQRVASAVGRPNVKVVHDPLGLKETMEIYYHAKACVGMRFHSVVMQTVLNGNNYIVDYTDPSTGKIVGMMKQLGIVGGCGGRYVSLHGGGPSLKIDLNSPDRLVYDMSLSKNWRKVYLDALAAL
jgi:polysaccharide pyruvyl transferase WcaK-like protein